MSENKDKFETWGLLELFGHQRLAGLLSEQTIGGCHFIRIDVPQIGDLPGYSRFFTNGAIYGMTPTTEEVARGLATQLRARPIQAYDLPRLQSSSGQRDLDPDFDEDDFHS
jgi:hypothetical protein